MLTLSINGICYNIESSAAPGRGICYNTQSCLEQIADVTQVNALQVEGLGAEAEALATSLFESLGVYYGGSDDQEKDYYWPQGQVDVAMLKEALSGCAQAWERHCSN